MRPWARVILVLVIVLIAFGIGWEFSPPDPPNVQVRTGQTIKFAQVWWWHPRKVSMVPYACPEGTGWVTCTLCEATSRTNFDCRKQ